VDKLFDLSQEYDSMLNQGLKFSGEPKEFFIEGRIRDLQKKLPKNKTITKILDFGCGIGNTSNILKKYFKNAEIVGTDLSEEALNYAKDKFRNTKIHFIHLNNIQSNYFDLVYVNGVFHHIEPEKQQDALNLIYNSLNKSGYFAFFENNPWNIGTKIIMNKIPFDKDAKTISSIKAQKLLKRTGFKQIANARYLFYFPKILSLFRFLEKYLVFLPLGSQYFILTKKDTYTTN
jgi:ubiquinone/menaquinone biosynthesis C-methylase UbiE